MTRPNLADGAECAYCGAMAREWDHVVPVALIRPNARRRYENDDWLVPACCECNGLLSDRMLHSVPLRAAWLLKRYRVKYAKLRLNAQWSDDEIEALEGSFRQLVIETMLAQSELDRRLNRLRWVSEQNGDYMKREIGR